MLLCRKISLALPNCNYTCWREGGEKGADAFSEARENWEIRKNIEV